MQQWKVSTCQIEELGETPETSSSAATYFSPFVIFMQMFAAAALIVVFGQLSARNRGAFLDPPSTGTIAKLQNASQPAVWRAPAVE